MITELYQKLIIPGFETIWKGRESAKYWKILEESQWYSRERLESLQFESLKRLVDYTFQHSPWYREKWNEQGLKKEMLQSPEDLRKWPIIRKEDIRAHRLQMRTIEPALKLYQKSSGGSTGSPVLFDVDWDSHDRKTAAWNRGYHWAHAEPGSKQLYLWGVPLSNVPKWKRYKSRLYDRLLYRRLVLNTFDLRDETIPLFFETHNRYQPKVIVAYAHPLYQFAKALEERNLKPYSPCSIIAAAEKLHDFQKATIERVFDAPVFDTYGSREFTLIGAECFKHEGFHLTMENLFVEILNDDGTPTPDGREGNVVITDLTNYGMPFIRYENGDRAIAGWKSCSCGRGLPLLEQVRGRQTDVLHTSDGRYVTGVFFVYLLKDYPSIEQFQVIQESKDQIELKLVVNDEWNQQTESIIELIIREHIGNEVQFEISIVDEIPLTPLGKTMVVINRCQRTPSTVSVED